MSVVSSGDDAGPDTTLDVPSAADEVDVGAFEDPALLDAVPVGPEPVAEPVRAVLSSAAVIDRLGRSGIPEVALRAYTRAADDRADTDPACGLRWTLVAAIGRVESDHGRFGGARLREDGTGTRAIRGIPLDGRPGVALIRDTDGGALDGDTTFDRAVGPMQFIPSTWTSVAVDGNGDGRRDPNNIVDAAHGAAAYLCAGGDLRTPAARAGAVRRYNHADEYVRVVLRLADAYEAGEVSAEPSLPAGSGAPTPSPSVPPPTPTPTPPPSPTAPARPPTPAPTPTPPPTPAPTPTPPAPPPPAPVPSSPRDTPSTPTTGPPNAPADPAAVGWAPAMRQVVVAVLEGEADGTDTKAPPAGPAAATEPACPADTTTAAPAPAASAPPEAAVADDTDADCPTAPASETAPGP
jgi:outer membrane biosynthesis protein TonB